jgi:CheY-like chemotaxis protein
MAVDHTEAGDATGITGELILVVEDDERTSRLERFVLEDEGYSVACAASGEKALEMLSDTDPALVLLDIMLPKLDGFGTCQKIREISEVPIIMVTGEGRDEDKVRGLEMGADDYITKPFSTNELAARVKAVLRRNSVARSIASTSPATYSEHETPVSGRSGYESGIDAGRNGMDGTTDEGQGGPEESSDHHDEQADAVGVVGQGPAENEKNYEGAVKLVVETTGAIKNMVDFVDALRGYPQFHLLRMVSNARRDGMDVWLRLREPNPLQITLLAESGVTSVEVVEGAEVDPETGSETPVPPPHPFPHRRRNRHPCHLLV